MCVRPAAVSGERVVERARACKEACKQHSIEVGAAEEKKGSGRRPSSSLHLYAGARAGPSHTFTQPVMPHDSHRSPPCKPRRGAEQVAPPLLLTRLSLIVVRPGSRLEGIRAPNLVSREPCLRGTKARRRFLMETAADRLIFPARCLINSSP